jgi:chromosome segregation ATPase
VTHSKAGLRSLTKLEDIDDIESSTCVVSRIHPENEFIMEPQNVEGSQPMEKISPLAAIQTLLDEQEETIHNLRAEKQELKVSETTLKQLLGKRDNTILHLTAEREELQNSVENWKHQKSEALEREKVLKLQAKEYEVRLKKLKQESPDHEATISRL